MCRWYKTLPIEQCFTKKRVIHLGSASIAQIQLLLWEQNLNRYESQLKVVEYVNYKIIYKKKYNVMMIFSSNVTHRRKYTIIRLYWKPLSYNTSKYKNIYLIYEYYYWMGWDSFIRFPVIKEFSTIPQIVFFLLNI